LSLFEQAALRNREEEIGQRLSTNGVYPSRTRTAYFKGIMAPPTGHNNKSETIRRLDIKKM
jgi:hypothetical protein